MKTTGEFIDIDGQLVWQEIHQYPLKDTGQIYIAYKTGDEKHLIYKLIKIPFGKKDEFFWSALWNTCAVCDKAYPSMDEAIRSKMKKGWIVKRTVFHELVQIISSL